jgi:hypothetical protein
MASSINKLRNDLQKAKNVKANLNLDYEQSSNANYRSGLANNITRANQAVKNANQAVKKAEAAAAAAVESAPEASASAVESAPAPAAAVVSAPAPAAAAAVVSAPAPHESDEKHDPSNEIWKLIRVTKTRNASGTDKYTAVIESSSPSSSSSSSSPGSSTPGLLADPTLLSGFGKKAATSSGTGNGATTLSKGGRRKRRTPKRTHKNSHKRSHKRSRRTRRR